LNRRWFLAVASMAGSVARSQSEPQLKAGTDRVDITPPLGIQMAGYNSTGRPATGVLDPLYAQALVLDDGRHSIALVTLDLIFTLLDPEMDAIRARVRQSSGIEDVIFVASHTHSGPIFMNQPEWNRKAVDLVASAIDRAFQKRVAARVGSGWGQSQIGANRRYQPVEGPEVMFWRNATKSPTFPVDPTVGVIRVDRADVTISLSTRQIERVVGGSRAPIGARFVNPETATVRSDVFTLTLRQRSTGALLWSGESATVTGALQRMQLALPRVPTLCVVMWCW